MKRAIILFLCVVAMVALLASQVSAAGSAQMTVTPSKGNPTRSETVEFTVSVTSVSNCKALGFVVSYDSNYFEWVSGQCLLDAAMKDFSGGTASMAFSDAKTVTGNVFKFTLRVKPGAKLNGTTSVGGTGSARDTGGALSVGVTAASVTIACNHTFGAWNNVGGGSHSRTCTACGAPDTRAHTYSNGCDKYCNECDAYRETSHKYSTNWSSNADYHWHECTVCGEWADDVRHTAGDPATETTAQTCTVCGYVIVPAIGHIHHTDGMWLSDETGHWQACDSCDEKAEFVAHTYDQECDSTCDVCEYVREVIHTPEENWYSDGDKHWHICSVCGEDTDKENHEADLTVEKPICDVCGAEVKHIHDYSADWTNDDSRHWHECSCGAKHQTGLHKWDEGTMVQAPENGQYGTMVLTCTVCAAQQSVVAVGVGTNQNMMFWYITCGALAVALVAALTVIVVIIVKVNKKPAGKYAGRK